MTQYLVATLSTNKFPLGTLTFYLTRFVYSSDKQKNWVVEISLPYPDLKTNQARVRNKKSIDFDLFLTLNPILPFFVSSYNTEAFTTYARTLTF